MKSVVIYHASCWDGFCAAYILRKVLPHDARFVSAHYGQDPPDDLEGKDVYIVDFSYPRHILLQIYEKARTLVVLDHHETAEDELSDLPFAKFDMTKSGARMAYDYVKGILPRADFSKGLGWMVDYTEDRDLWRWDLLNSREINAAFRTYPLCFETWQQIEDDETSLHRLAMEGSGILRYQEGLVNSARKNSFITNLCGYDVRAVNATNLISEIGHALASDEKVEFAVTWFDKDDGDMVFSLRHASKDEDRVHLGELAKARFGGGGHKDAAGFSWNYIVDMPFDKLKVEGDIW